MTKTGFSLKSNNIINRASETKDRLAQGDNQLGHGGGDSDGDDDGDGVGCTICYWWSQVFNKEEIGDFGWC